MKLPIKPDAVAKVRDPLPAPTECRYCGAPVELVNNSEIYNGRSYGAWPYAYKCTSCDSHVGVHKYTDIPLGTLADADLRSWRQAAKENFNPLWQDGAMSRTEAYAWLAQKLGIERAQCHIGMMETEQCIATIEAVRHG